MYISGYLIEDKELNFGHFLRLTKPSRQSHIPQIYSRDLKPVGGKKYSQFVQISRQRVAEDASELKLWKDIDEVEMTEPEQEQSVGESDEDDTSEY